MRRSALVILFCFLLSIFSAAAASANTIITVENKCPYSIWPGVFSDRHSVAVENAGITLPPGASFPVAAPYLWKGRILATTVCSYKPSTIDSADTACNGAYDPNIPATHVQFSLGSSASNATDYYSISLADGYNLPVKVVPQGFNGRDSDCSSVECVADINDQCPADLRVTLPNAPATVGCRSACQTFGTDLDCCKGKFENPRLCPTTQYTKFFKEACPQASSYAQDKPVAPPVCSTAATPSYKVVFCPAPSATSEHMLKDEGLAKPQALSSLNLTGLKNFLFSEVMAVKMQSSSALRLAAGIQSSWMLIVAGVMAAMLMVTYLIRRVLCKVEDLSQQLPLFRRA